MRLFADENMARAIVVRLRIQGHDVVITPTKIRVRSLAT
jgi:hypothetical protein